MTRKTLAIILMALVCSVAFAGVVDFTGGVTYGLNYRFKDNEITPWKDGSGVEGMEAKLTAKVTSTYFTITLQGDLTSQDPYERGLKGYLSFKLGKALNNTYFPDLPSGTFTLLAGNQGAMTALRAYPDYFSNYYDRLRTTNKGTNTFALTITHQPYQGRIYCSPVTDGIDYMGAFIYTPSTDWKMSLTAVRYGLYRPNGMASNYFFKSGAVNASLLLDLESMLWLNNPISIALTDTYTFGAHDAEYPLVNVAAAEIWAGLDEVFDFYAEFAWIMNKGEIDDGFDLNAKVVFDMVENLELSLKGRHDLKENWSAEAAVAYTLDALTTTLKVTTDQDGTWMGTILFASVLDAI
ncbi:MAG: hypothetical protein IJ863_02925 [Spirochaetales bacterium]|nr:hypothetical protein [Spirochaetales bacterium]